MQERQIMSVINHAILIRACRETICGYVSMVLSMAKTNKRRVYSKIGSGLALQHCGTRPARGEAGLVLIELPRSGHGEADPNARRRASRLLSSGLPRSESIL